MLLAGFFVLAKNVSAQDITPDNTERIIVKFRAFSSETHREGLLNSLEVSKKEKLSLKDTLVLQTSKSKKNEVFRKLSANPFVEYVELDSVATAQENPNDPEFVNQWGMTKIFSPSGWDLSHGSGSVDIAIVDTGINCTISGCPVQTSQDPNGHGTHVAGIASAATNNLQGVAGVAWEGRLMSIKALSDNASGYYSWITDGVVYAVDNGAEVINLSLGGTSQSITLESAINYAWSRGVIVVAAAGNNGRSQKFYPAYYTNSIAVAATDSTDRKASFSNHGNWVDVAAPGVSILSTYKNTYRTMSGTSMSAPHVAGLAALILGQNPGWNNSAVRSRIEQTADRINGTGNYWLWGRINVCKSLGGCESLSLITSPTPSLSPIATPTIVIPSPSPTPVPTPTLSPSPIPTSTPLPWICKYFPNHSSCD